MCGSPESNLAMTLMKGVGGFASSFRKDMMKNMGMDDMENSREDEEIERIKTYKKQEAIREREERKELGRVKKGSLRATTASNGIVVDTGTAKDILNNEDIATEKDTQKIDAELDFALKTLSKKQKRPSYNTVLTDRNFKKEGMNSFGALNFGGGNTGQKKYKK